VAGIRIKEMRDGAWALVLACRDDDAMRLIDAAIQREVDCRQREPSDTLTMPANREIVLAMLDREGMLETDDTNWYRCSECQHEWEDEWSSGCNDECPDCGARDVEPYYRGEDGPEREAALAKLSESNDDGE
jgi:rubrerythrin